jgi:hypothetical protein
VRLLDKEISMAKIRATQEPLDVAANDGFAPASESDIARRAYSLYLARGAEPGRDVEDWLRAERELREMDAEAAAAYRDGIATATRQSDQHARSELEEALQRVGGAEP